MIICNVDKNLAKSINFFFSGSFLVCLFFTYIYMADIASIYRKLNRRPPWKRKRRRKILKKMFFYTAPAGRWALR